MTKVVTVAGIARDRVGNVHQICEFLTIAATREGAPGTTGIQITLSAKDVDAKTKESAGYCEPLDKGFMLADMSESARKRFLSRKRQGPPGSKSANKSKAEDLKSSKAADAAKSASSPKSRDASAKTKKKQNRDKKSSADNKKVDDSSVAVNKNLDASASESK